MKTLPLALLISAGLASAQTPDAELARCASLAEPAARLACLDPLVAAAVARLQPAAQAKAQEQAFGVAAPPAAKRAAPPVPDSLDSEIEGYVDGWRPNTHFKLKNGQVWRVSDGSSGDLGLRNPKVRVKRNFLGTYFLEFEGRNDAPKVRRVE